MRYSLIKLFVVIASFRGAVDDHFVAFCGILKTHPVLYCTMTFPTVCTVLYCTRCIVLCNDSCACFFTSILCLFVCTVPAPSPQIGLGPPKGYTISSHTFLVEEKPIMSFSCSVYEFRLKIFLAWITKWRSLWLSPCKVFWMSSCLVWVEQPCIGSHRHSGPEFPPGTLCTK